MKRSLCTGILAASVVAGYVYWQTNSSGYCLDRGCVYGPSWYIGTSPYCIGLGERTKIGMPSERGKKLENLPYTQIDFGSQRFRIKARAWQVTLVGAFFFGIAAHLSCLALVTLFEPKWNSKARRPSPRKSPVAP